MLLSRTYLLHVSELSLWYLSHRWGTLSGRLWIPVTFRSPAFASWSFLPPPSSSAFLAVGLPGSVVTLAPGQRRIFTFTNGEVRSGWGALYTPGSLVSLCHRKRRFL